jgi:hypothetical protein
MTRVNKIPTGTVIKFVGCGECTGRTTCFFCKEGVKNKGVVAFAYPDFDIPTIEVKVEGADCLLELTQADIEDPGLISRIVLS